MGENKKESGNAPPCGWLAIDAHVHLYEGYDLARYFVAALANFHHWAPAADGSRPAALGLGLAERAGQTWFRDLAAGRLRLPAGLTATPLAAGAAVRIALPNAEPLDLFPGRQVNTRERLEVLTPGYDLDIPDGLTIREVLDRVHTAGGLPVIGWAPGKWVGLRGQILRGLLEAATGNRLALCDSISRPRGWPEPRLFGLARARGCKILAGSDPLPRAGEERLPGSYGLLVPMEGADGDPAAAWRGFLGAPGAIVQVRGTRLALPAMAWRWWSARRGERKAA